MSTSGSTTDPVESITVQLGELELTISVRHRGGSSGAESAPSAAASASVYPQAGVSTEVNPPIASGTPFSAGLVSRVIAAETAAD